MILQLPDGLTYNTALSIFDQAPETQNFLFEIMRHIVPVKEFETVDLLNKRPLKEVYERDGIRITKVYEYNYALPTKEWAGVTNQYYTVELI